MKQEEIQGSPEKEGSVWLGSSFVAIGASLRRNSEGGRRCIGVQTDEPEQANSQTLFRRRVAMVAVAALVIGVAAGACWLINDRNTWRAMYLELQRAQALGPMPAAPRTALGGASLQHYRIHVPTLGVMPAPAPHNGSSSSEWAESDVVGGGGSMPYLFDGCWIKVQMGECARRLVENTIGTLSSIVFDSINVLATVVSTGAH